MRTLTSLATSVTLVVGSRTLALATLLVQLSRATSAIAERPGPSQPDGQDGRGANVGHVLRPAVQPLQLGLTRTIRGVKSWINARHPTQPASVGKALDADARIQLLYTIEKARLVADGIQQDIGHAQRQLKSDQSPVTIADYAVQAIVSMGLWRTLGPVRLVGEENTTALRGWKNRDMRRAVVAAVRRVDPGASTHEILTAIDRGNDAGDSLDHWTLDPIDGTKGFLRGGQYAISLGRIKGGTLDVGFLASPNLSPSPRVSPDTICRPGVILYAERGKGTYLLPGGEITAVPRRLAVSGPPPGEVCVVARVEGEDARGDQVDALRTHLGRKVRIVELDSASKYPAAVFHNGIYFRTGSNKIWDHAGGVIVAEEAGMKVTDLDGQPLDFSTGTMLRGDRGILVAVPELHADVLRALGKASQSPASR